MILFLQHFSLNKKSRTTQKELKLEKPEPKLKNLQEKRHPTKKTPKKGER